jgi:hypothetical protein
MVRYSISWNDDYTEFAQFFVDGMIAKKEHKRKMITLLKKMMTKKEAQIVPENQCATCTHGHTLRIHVLSGRRNCEAGGHNPSERCSDFTSLAKAPTDSSIIVGS